MPDDYDYEGWLKKYGTPKQQKWYTSGSHSEEETVKYLQPSGKHFTDEFKNPSHLTFSSGSIYSKPGQEGGEWIERKSEIDPISGKPFWDFYPSKFNLEQYTPKEYKRRWSQEGTDARVNLPDGANIVGSGNRLASPPIRSYPSQLLNYYYNKYRKEM